MAIINVTTSNGHFRTVRINTEYTEMPDYELVVRIRDAVQAAERIEAIKPGQQVTKWDMIGDWERKSLDNTPHTKPEVISWDPYEERRVPGWCSGCHEPLPTEGAFARHYILTDLHYTGLGECPKGTVPRVKG